MGLIPFRFPYAATFVVELQTYASNSTAPAGYLVTNGVSFHVGP